MNSSSSSNNIGDAPKKIFSKKKWNDENILTEEMWGQFSDAQ